MSTGIVFHAIAAIIYLGLSATLWGMLQAGQSMERPERVARWLLLPGLVAHGVGLDALVLAGGNLHLSWLLALSVAVWLGLIVFWFESLIIKIDGLQLLVLPFAGVICVLTALYPGSHLVTSSVESALRGHLLLALGAYGLITIAAMQSLLMAAVDHHLHHPRDVVHNASALRRAIGRVLDAQPPLLVQERLLFRVIWIAFAALTLAIISGSLISLATVGNWLPFDHKSVFTVLSWLTFGMLLLGRHRWGWRGRIALRYTVVGFIFVVLSYTGSRFVIEVILNRG